VKKASTRKFFEEKVQKKQKKEAACLNFFLLRSFI
jgi:hypothetical protein